MINNLTKELAESLAVIRNFANIGEIPAATYMVKADAVLDRYIDALRTPEPVITRVEVITDKGRDYVNWEQDNRITTSLQDDGKTLKIFVTNDNTEEPEMPITKPNSYEVMPSEKKSVYNLTKEPEMPITKPNSYEVMPSEKKSVYNLTKEPEMPIIKPNSYEVMPSEKKSVYNLTKEPEMTITKPEFTIEPEVIEDLWGTTANYKTFANSIADIMSSSTKESVSKQWAIALTNFIDELGGDGPALWGWEDKTPTPEKVVECLRDNIQYIADGELESCCVVVEMNEGRVSGNVLRAIRRPQPTLKSQALKDFETVRKHSDLLPEILDTIENALKSLPE